MCARQTYNQLVSIQTEVTRHLNERNIRCTWNHDLPAGFVIQEDQNRRYPNHYRTELTLECVQARNIDTVLATVKLAHTLRQWTNRDDEVDQNTPGAALLNDPTRPTAYLIDIDQVIRDLNPGTQNANSRPFECLERSRPIPYRIEGAEQPRIAYSSSDLGPNPSAQAGAQQTNGTPAPSTSPSQPATQPPTAEPSPQGRVVVTEPQRVEHNAPTYADLLQRIASAANNNARRQVINEANTAILQVFRQRP